MKRIFTFIVLLVIVMIAVSNKKIVRERFISSG